MRRRPQHTHMHSGKASRRVLITLWDRGELTAAECADASGISLQRASVLLYSAYVRGHVHIRVGRCAVRYYSITKVGRDAMQVLMLARERLRDMGTARSMRILAREAMA